MKIQDAEFAGAIATPEGVAPAQLDEVAFSGRSNVGKSTLINHLLGRTRRKLARVSTTPGKTQEINFYRVKAKAQAGAKARAERSVEFFLIDLPGYGYARVPGNVREKWRPLIEGYLKRSKRLRGVVQLIDARRGATDDDRQMISFLAALGTPTLVVLTKIDKLKRREREATVEKIAGSLGLDLDQVVPFSAITGEGRDSLLGSVQALLLES